MLTSDNCHSDLAHGRGTVTMPGKNVRKLGSSCQPCSVNKLHSYIKKVRRETISGAERSL